MRNKSKVSRILHATIPVLKACLFKMVGDTRRRPPSARRLLQMAANTLFSDVEHVADTTLVQVARARHHQLERALYSTYIPGHKGKVLISCGADGYVLFVSKVFASTATDEEMAFQSGWFDTIRPGEEILFDKGASEAMRVEIERRGGILITPAYCRQQFLTSAEVASSIGVAQARVVIENVNERVKRFRILQHTIPSTLFHWLDDIVAVCAYLTSYMGPIRARTAGDAVDTPAACVASLIV